MDGRQPTLIFAYENNRVFTPKLNKHENESNRKERVQLYQMCSIDTGQFSGQRKCFIFAVFALESQTKNEQLK